ncbi:MAG: hypothetical protein NXI09_14070 [Bacteroidetes bacterium]|nr:hypothetical protein [Bacteroidota bacterium]
MHYKPTVFDRAISDENHFTELFHNFLQHEEFKDRFIDLLGVQDPHSEPLRFKTSTQNSIGEFGQPDMLVYSENEAYFLIEIKVYNTNLTENQPKGYYQKLLNLDKTSRRGLILIAPRYYAHLNIYNERLQEIYKSHDSIFTKILSWEEIIEMMAGLKQTKSNPLFKEYLQFLRNWFKHYPQYLTNSENQIMHNKETGIAFQKSMSLIHHVLQKLEAMDGTKILRKSFTLDSFEEYGFYIKLQNQKEIFFGLWFDLWAEHGTPFCVCTNCEDLSFSQRFTEKAQALGFVSPIDFQNWKTLSLQSETLNHKNAEDEITKVLLDLTKSLNNET